MKRILLSLAVLCLLSGGTAVVGGPNDSEGDMTITSGSSSSATTSVGPNGTDWQTSLSNKNSSCRGANASENFNFIGFQGDGEFTELNFEGVVNANNPCVEISLETEEINENVYRIDIKESSANGPCVRCLGAIKFSGSFSAPGDYKVSIIHENKTLGTQKTPGFEEKQESSKEDNESKDKNTIESLFNWFSSFF